MIFFKAASIFTVFWVYSLFFYLASPVTTNVTKYDFSLLIDVGRRFELARSNSMAILASFVTWNSYSDIHCISNSM